LALACQQDCADDLADDGHLPVFGTIGADFDKRVNYQRLPK
jgi:hypothetical protein